MTIDDIQWLGLGLVGLYLVLVEVLRFHLVGRPARALLEARVDGVRETARHLRLDDADPLFRMLDDAQVLLGRRRFPWIWTGGGELAGWTLVHRAERMLVPPDRGDRDSPLRALHDAEDRAFDRLATLQRHAAYLGIVGLLFVGGVVLLGPSLVAVVFVGAVGGFLNAMRRAMRARSAAFDDGAVWASMMVAPVIGALAAFAGIELVQLGSGIGVLTLPAGLTLSNPPDPSILGLALLLGFAEQFFEAPTDVKWRPEAELAGSEATRIVLAARVDVGATTIEPISAPTPVAAPPAVSAPTSAPAAATTVEPTAPSEVSWPSVPPIAKSEAVAAPAAPAEEAPLTTYINWPSAPAAADATTTPAIPADTAPLTTYINWPSAEPNTGSEPPDVTPSDAPAEITWPKVPEVASTAPKPEAEVPAKPAAPVEWP
jgi:hypothetical protein